MDPELVLYVRHYYLFFDIPLCHSTYSYILPFLLASVSPKIAEGSTILVLNLQRKTRNSEIIVKL